MAKGNKLIGGLLLTSAALGGALLAWKSGAFGATGADSGFVPQGLSPDKDRAQRWLESQLNRDRHLDRPRVEAIDAGLSLETGKARELSNVIQRMRGNSVKYEHVSPYGVGVPE